ncbi:MAG TPA: hypothetical protein DDY20_10470 [Desulfobulbaceae bacterium]|nr:hypothetical protein [Desulfobulbaceae bacterium]
MRLFAQIAVAFIYCLSALGAAAQDRVVVIPLGGKKGSPAPVAKTGQSSCYDSDGDSISCADSGQDGELQKGVAWPVPRFTDKGDGTVADNLTGLIWLMNANCIGMEIPGFDRDLVNGDGKVTRQHALNFVAGLNSGTIRDDLGAPFPTNCGDASNGGTHQSDWRLPNRFELESLLDIGQVGPPLPSGHPFINVVLDYYWTSSYDSYYYDLGVGWAVHFSAGDVEAKSWKLEPCYAWPVRGGE